MAPEAVREMYRLIDAREFGAFAELYDKDAVYYRPGCDALVGREQIEHYYDKKRNIRSGKHTVSRVVQDGQTIAVEGSFSGVLDDGREQEHRFAEFFELSDDGLFTRRDSFLFVTTF
ncbi:MAG TPA: nuclear transport factor 2 family protein [Jatrophihabitans sp.]|jgi:ketosteroid isomerase-like protein|uniref:nuclear transport factor 2 family protein n=1 Tax=Jatrophihabitans sp. TaxID=1932789 RepID=UPI002EE8137F